MWSLEEREERWTEGLGRHRKEGIDFRLLTRENGPLLGHSLEGTNEG